ncbi:ABC transporter permease, partial [Rhizobium ruizarguesonis]
MTEPPSRNPEKAAAKIQQKRPELRVRPTAPILPPSNIQGSALMVV